jgi:hypothetical protein
MRKVTIRNIDGLQFGFFHCWLMGPDNEVYAVIELPDGSIRQLHRNALIFNLDA